MSVCPAQSSTRSRGAWTKTKVSKNVQTAVTIHHSLSTTVCTSVDTFPIVYAILDSIDGCARHPDKVCVLSHFVSRTKKRRNFHSIVSLRSHFEIHNDSKPFSSMSQLQNIAWVKQKPNNNCQTTRLVTKIFVQFFSARPPGILFCCIMGIDIEF